MTLTLPERIALARKYHADGAITQNAWERHVDGREMVCALAAFGPDIRGSDQCPADLMPQWLAYLVPAIDDGIASNEVLWFSGELIERAARWHVLDAGAWERIRTGFMIAAIRRAIETASPVQPFPPPEYWTQVVAACEGVIAALEEGGDPEKLRAAADAAYAADAAAYAADAAADAAYAAADAAKAAYAAAYAADAAYAAAKAADATAKAAKAAYAAADAAYAAYAAYAAAWKDVAITLFGLIDCEIEAASNA